MRSNLEVENVRDIPPIESRTPPAKIPRTACESGTASRKGMLSDLFEICLTGLRNGNAHASHRKNRVAMLVDNFGLHRILQKND